MATGHHPEHVDRVYREQHPRNPLCHFAYAAQLAAALGYVLTWQVVRKTDPRDLSNVSRRGKYLVIWGDGHPRHYQHATLVAGDKLHDPNRSRAVLRATAVSTFRRQRMHPLAIVAIRRQRKKNEPA